MPLSWSLRFRCWGVKKGALRTCMLNFRYRKHYQNRLICKIYPSLSCLFVKNCLRFSLKYTQGWLSLTVGLSGMSLKALWKFHRYPENCCDSDVYLQTGLGVGPRPDGLQSRKAAWQSSERAAGWHSELVPSSSAQPPCARNSCACSGSGREELKKTSADWRNSPRHTSPRYILQ